MNCNSNNVIFVTRNRYWVRLNYATTHHYPPSPTTSQNISTSTHQHLPAPTTSQNVSTTTHHHPPPAKIYPPSSTTNHHQPKYIHHHPTNSQNISTTTYHFPKSGPPPRKSQKIFIYNLLLTLL